MIMQLTLTGADEHTDVAELAKLDAEIGFLFCTAGDGNRYPRWDWIVEAASAVPKAALHVCGRAAKTRLLMDEIDLSVFSRVQLNGEALSLEIERLCGANPEKVIITQHHLYNAHLLSVKAPNHVVLVDGSGGRGRSPETWRAPKTSKAVGFAGGLGPDNLEAEIQRMPLSTGWWVDMENKLRVDDLFSIERAQECVEAFKRAVSAMR